MGRDAAPCGGPCEDPCGGPCGGPHGDRGSLYRPHNLEDQQEASHAVGVREGPAHDADNLVTLPSHCPSGLNVQGL